MGQGGSSLADSACDGDIQSLKAVLEQRKQQQETAKGDADARERWVTEIEDAMHAVVSMEIHSAQQFQQLQIALELLLQAQPDAWAKGSANAARWTGAHRACVTGNLSFLAFVFQHFDAYDMQERDAFGLFPIDLVPPEVLRTPAEMALDAAQEPLVGGKTPIFPATARSRRNLALQILRQKKHEAQARCIDQFLFHEHASQRAASRALAASQSEAHSTSSSSASTGPTGGSRSTRDDASTDTGSSHNSNNAGDSSAGECASLTANNSSVSETEPRKPSDTAAAPSNQDEATLSPRFSPELAATGAYYIAFEPSRERLESEASALPSHSIGEVHERGTPLRLKYRFPRIDEFLNGYFQLIWRAGESEPRSEEPHYGPHVLVRDEMFLDPQCVDLFGQDAPDRTLHLQEIASDTEPDALDRCMRRLEDRNPVLQGCFPFDVSRIPHDAVCNVLFVASDKHLMKRTVVLSTEGIALRDAKPDERVRDNNSSGSDDGSDSYDGDESDESDSAAVHSSSGFRFHVAGEAFRHPNPVFAGKTFDGIDDFEAFVKALRLSRATEQAPAQAQDQAEVQEEDNQRSEAGEGAVTKSLMATHDPDAAAAAAPTNEQRSVDATETSREDATLKPSPQPLERASPQQQQRRHGRAASQGDADTQEETRAP